VILAAGKGTRMRSRLPKVLHAVGGRPMLEHVLRAASAAVSTPTTSTASEADPSPSPDAPGADGDDHSTHFAVVVGHEREQVRDAIGWAPARGRLTYVEQEPQLGTGHAMQCARPELRDAMPPITTVLVLYGDTPLIRAETLRALLAEHHTSRATLTFLTGLAEDPTGYGRVLRGPDGAVAGIVEQKHATPEQRAIREINSGIYCFDAAWLWSHLDGLEPHDNGEYYLTDLVDVAVREGRPVRTATAPFAETMGVNDRVQLAEAERVIRERVLRDLMLSGVTVQDPAATYVEAGVRVGQDTTLRPGTFLRGATVIGERCEIGPNSVIVDSTIGDDCEVLASWLDSATLDSGSRIGPMSRMRAGARLKRGANLGNFAEVKNATIGERVQMHHFSYVGDANVGAGTNIGAGAITMNYDGKAKHHTEIGEGVFIGSDTLLRAPVTIGDGAATGAGAVVTRDVPPGKLAVGMPARIRSRGASARSGDTSGSETKEQNEMQRGERDASSPAPAGEPPAARGEGE